MMNIVNDAVDNIAQMESSILDRELIKFLSSHNLTLENYRKNGYVVLTEHYQDEGDGHYTFVLAKIEDQKKIKIKIGIKIK